MVQTGYFFICSVDASIIFLRGKPTATFIQHEITAVKFLFSLDLFKNTILKKHTNNTKQDDRRAA